MTPLRRKAPELELLRKQIDQTSPCGCCNNCIEKMPVNSVLEYRLRLYVLPQGPPRQTKLIELYKMANVSNRWGKEAFIFNGETVCRKAWSKICLGISERTYQRLKANIRNGVHYVESNIAYSNMNRGVRGNVAVGFMQWFVEETGDFSPDSSTIMMPSCLTIKHLYKEYLFSNKENTIQCSRFYMLWNLNFKHVSFPKNPHMTQCKMCVLLKECISKEVNMEVRQALIHQRNEHLTRQQKERQAYYKRRAEAQQNTDKIMSVIIDGMDQQKGDLPHFKGHADPKGIGQFKLKTHITGALYHSRNQLYSMIDAGQYSHDTNLTLTCLLEVIYKETSGGQLPPILYIQLDNCGRENKNKFFIGFMAYLVKNKYLKEITMSFLMVGHTHEDIDQRLSKYAHKLRLEDAKTLDDLISLLERSMDPQPILSTLKVVWNIRDWLSPCLEEIHNQSFPHMYRIFLDKNDDVKVQFKHWSTDEVWKPEDKSLDIFRWENGVQMIPLGQPAIVPMNFKQEDIAATKQSIVKSKDVLSFEQFEWWQNLLDKPELHISKYSHQPEEWYLNLLQGYRETMPSTQITIQKKHQQL